MKWNCERFFRARKGFIILEIILGMWELYCSPQKHPPPLHTHILTFHIVYPPQKGQDPPHSKIDSHEAITQPPREPTLTQLQPTTTSSSLESSSVLSLSVHNVKMYEISTSKYLHIVLSILFIVHNLTIANWGPKHVVVIAFLPTLLN